MQSVCVYVVGVNVFFFLGGHMRKLLRSTALGQCATVCGWVG